MDNLAGSDDLRYDIRSYTVSGIYPLIPLGYHWEYSCTGEQKIIFQGITIIFELEINLPINSGNICSGQTVKHSIMANYIKWIGGGLGWAFGGPIGGIIGFLFGSMFDNMNGEEIEFQNLSGKPTTTPGDFSVSLLILSAAVMRSDEKVMRSELDFVRNFFLKQFGADYTEKQMLMLRAILKQDFNLPEVCQQIKQYMDYPSRLQLLHFLFGVAWADGSYHPEEIETIGQIGHLLGISGPDYASVKAMFVKDTARAYIILEIGPEATDEEVKKAYRKMALKYHPDRVTHLGVDIQKAAHGKFQELNNAYNEIKKQRKMG